MRLRVESVFATFNAKGAFRALAVAFCPSSPTCVACESAPASPGVVTRDAIKIHCLFAGFWAGCFTAVYTPWQKHAFGNCRQVILLGPSLKQQYIDESLLLQGIAHHWCAPEAQWSAQAFLTIPSPGTMFPEQTKNISISRTAGKGNEGKGQPSNQDSESPPDSFEHE